MRWMLFLQLLVGNVAHAQLTDTIQYHSIKLDFANFVDDVPAFLISYQHPIGENLYMVHEGGPVLPSFTDDRKTSGFKLKEELRLFIDRWNTTDMYLGLAIRYSHENIYTNIVYGKECNGEWRCTYYQNYYGEFQKKMISFDLRLGFKHNFHPFFIEYDLGYGYGKDNIYTPEIEAGEGSVKLSKNPYNTSIDGLKILLSGRANFGFNFLTGKRK